MGSGAFLIFLLTLVRASLVPLDDRPADHAPRGPRSVRTAADVLATLLGERTDRVLTVDLQSRRIPGRGRCRVRLAHHGPESFSIRMQSGPHDVRIDRTANTTRLALPRRGVVFVGTGPVAETASLRPRGLAHRILSPSARIRAWHTLLVLLRRLDGGRGQVSAAVLRGLDRLVPALEIRDGPQPGTLTIRMGTLTIRMGTRLIRMGTSPVGSAAEASAPTPPRAGDLREVSVDRTELERVVLRAVRRAGEVVFPVPRRLAPVPRKIEVRGGSMRTVGPLRLVLLRGTPTEVGRAHGRLLRRETHRAIDSTYHLAGLGYTIDQGAWFPDVLRAAWRRLAPHIPPDHLTEMDALADAAGISRETVRLANVFPELFHCSGFAVFGRATREGKLYHGRVLDYMTLIGLQHAATVFVIAVNGKHAFVNVGYAGFVGSVTGMNACRVSLGEMGGRGEGDWDGVPMAMLMRQALEECDGLEDVIDLWRRSPRTCVHYYVFADGKIPDAVAVAATPETLEIARAGESRERLGPGIPDAVVISGGDRLTELRRRVSAGHGAIDAAAAIRLMARPVSMRSNLHNALFAPQSLTLWVAHADDEKPAADRAYTRIDLGALLEELRRGTTAGRR